MEFEDSIFQIEAFMESREAKFLQPRARKKDYPTRTLFRTTEARANVYRAYQIQVGRGKNRVSRRVPDLLSVVEGAGGLMEGLGYFNTIITLLFFMPFDYLELFYSM
jgi:hypothetical protein